MSDHQPWISDLIDADEAHVTVAALAGPLPNGVDLEAFASGLFAITKLLVYT